VPSARAAKAGADIASSVRAIARCKAAGVSGCRDKGMVASDSGGGTSVPRRKPGESEQQLRPSWRDAPGRLFGYQNKRPAMRPYAIFSMVSRLARNDDCCIAA
jgi:hypothetical protein